MDHFARGVAQFQVGNFFAAHEEWEEVWRTAAAEERFFYQGLIHIAAGCYHQQRGNALGRDLQFAKGLAKLAGYLPVWRGLATATLSRSTEETWRQWQEGNASHRICWPEPSTARF